MPTQTVQKTKYKICTTNCLAYKHPGDYGCEKGNFAFQPPLGRACTFGLLEGELERTPEQSSASSADKKTEKVILYALGRAPITRSRLNLLQDLFPERWLG